MSEIFIKNGLGSWKLVYLDNNIDPVGFYWVNAGDPPTYSHASQDDVYKALEELVEAARQVAEAGEDGKG